MPPKGVKYGSYKRRFHVPVFGGGLKTTTREGKNAYMKEYMQKVRAMEKQK